ncbi:MAG: AMP-binding protein, partial [Campylobacterales bacterium]|nr:AMP-binding protein [Campylobacterales bacterium]
GSNEKDTIEDILEQIVAQANQANSEPILMSQTQQISGKEFVEKVETIETQIKKLNLTPSHRVALRFEDALTHLLFHFTFLKLGILIININPKDVIAIQKEDLAIASNACIFQDVPLQNSLSAKTLYVDSTMKFHYQEKHFIDHEIAQDALNQYAFAFYGSGTTGKKKIIGITRQSLAAQIARDTQVSDFQSGQYYYTMTNFYFNTPKRRVLSALYRGLRVYLSNARPSNIIAFLNQYPIHHVALTTNQALIVLSEIKTQPSQPLLPNLQSLIVSGSTVSTQLKEKIQRYLTPNLYIGYGSNECGELCVASPDCVLAYDNTVGKPFEDVEIKIVDDKGNECGINEVGSIIVKAKDRIEEYPNNPEESQKYFKDGWFYIGDLGKFTDDGFLIYHGRADDMMIFTGVNIYPIEIETVLNTHPNILEAAVVALQMDDRGDVPYAAVVANKRLDEKTLLQWIVQYLGWKRPQRVFFFKQLPKSPQGKIMKKDLIAMIEEELIKEKEPKSIKYPKGKYKYQQPSLNANIGLPKNLMLDLSKIDHWLENVLKAEVLPYDATLSLGDNEEKNSILHVVWRLLLLRKTLFQALGVPLFDAGDILAIHETHDKYQIITQLTKIDHITPKLNHLVLQISISLLTKLFQNQSTLPNIKALYDEIETKWIKPYKKITASGKSTLPTLQATHSKKIPFTHLSQGIYQLGWGANLKIMQASRTGEDSAIGAVLSENKFNASIIVRDAGLPAPKHGLVDSYTQALEIAQKIGFPLVTKPSDLNRGEGVSVDIDNETALKEGFELAHKLSKNKHVIVEEQVQGVCCRIFVANGKMYYALNRLPKSVIGDGKKNVKRLIEEANKKNLALPPWKREEIFPSDDEAIQSIKKAGFTLKSIPKMGELVPLRRIESTQWGGYDQDVTSTIHPDNVDIALRV